MLRKNTVGSGRREERHGDGEQYLSRPEEPGVIIHSQWHRFFIGVSVIVVIASVLVMLAGPRRYRNVDSFQRAEFTDGLIQIQTVEIAEYMSMPMMTGKIAYEEVPFVPLMNTRIKGKCLPSGIRQDFCVNYGTLDTSFSLFTSLPSCRAQDPSSFIGGCRTDDETVIDYCITTQDVNNTLCLSYDQPCQLESIDTPDVLVTITNASMPVISFPVNISMTSNTTNISMLLNIHLTPSAYSSTPSYVRVYTINGELAIAGTSPKSVLGTHAGYVAVDLLFTLDVEGIRTEDPFDITSIEVFISNMQENATIVLQGLYTSSCGHPDSILYPLVPTCYDDHPVAGQTHLLNLEIPPSVAAESISSGKRILGGLRSAKLLDDTQVARLPTGGYVLFIVSALSANNSLIQPTTSINSSDIYRSFQTGGNYSANDIRNLLFFQTDTVYYDLIIDSSMIQGVLVPVSIASFLYVTSDSSIALSVTPYTAFDPQCLFHGIGNYTFFHVLSTTTNKSPPVRMYITIDTTDAFYATQEAQSSNATGAYASFYYEEAALVINDPLSQGSPKACALLVNNLNTNSSADLTYVTVTTSTQGQWDLKSPLWLEGASATVVVRLGTIWSPLVNPSIQPPNPKNTKTSIVFYLYGMQCFSPTNDEAQDIAVTESFRSATKSLTPGFLYANDSTIHHTGLLRHSGFSYRTTLSSIYGICENCARYSIATLPHPIELPPVPTVECTIGTKCVIPYTPVGGLYDAGLLVMIVYFTGGSYNFNFPLSGFGTMRNSIYTNFLSGQFETATGQCAAMFPYFGEDTFSGIGSLQFRDGGAYFGTAAWNEYPAAAPVELIQLSNTSQTTTPILLCGASCLQSSTENIGVYTMRVPSAHASSIRNTYIPFSGYSRASVPGVGYVSQQMPTDYSLIDALVYMNGNIVTKTQSFNILTKNSYPVCKDS
jgi:hypothetical protein